MYNVLIADDEKNICEGIAEFLDWQELGFHIIGLAANGEEALNMLSWQRCELILTDIRMPGIDGLALIRRIQEKDPGLRSSSSAATVILPMPSRPLRWG